MAQDGVVAFPSLCTKLQELCWFSEPDSLICFHPRWAAYLILCPYFLKAPGAISNAITAKSVDGELYIHR